MPKGTMKEKVHAGELEDDILDDDFDKEWAEKVHQLSATADKLTVRIKGGTGSGHHGHGGLKGVWGGSTPGKGGGSGSTTASDPNKFTRAGSEVTISKSKYGWQYEVRHPEISLVRDYEKTEEKARQRGKAVATMLNSPDGRAQLAVNHAFSTYYYSPRAGLPYVAYRARKNGVLLEDHDYKYGNMRTSIDLEQLNRWGFKDVKSFTDVLDKYKGGKIKPRKRVPMVPIYD